MIEFLLDSSTLAGLLYAKPLVVQRFRPLIDQGKVATSFICYGEVFESASTRHNPELHLRTLRELLAAVPPLGVTQTIAERYATIRPANRPPYDSGLIGDIDTLIAATAIENDLTLVTTDTDFSRVTGLRLLLLRRRTFDPIDSNQ